jgi:hypothetical protein
VSELGGGVGEGAGVSELGSGERGEKGEAAPGSFDTASGSLAKSARRVTVHPEKASKPAGAEGPEEPEEAEASSAVVTNHREVVVVTKPIPNPVCLGTISGKAKVTSREVLKIQLPEKLRPGAKAKIRTDYPCLKVVNFSQVGRTVTLGIEVDSKRSLTLPFRLTLGSKGEEIVCQGQVNIGHPEPSVMGISAVCNGKGYGEPQLQEQITETTKWHAYFDPEQPQFWVTKKSGTISPGMTTFPTRVVWAPTDRCDVEGQLVFDLGDSEITYRVCGTLAAFEGRRRGGRKQIVRTPLGSAGHDDSVSGGVSEYEWLTDSSLGVVSPAPSVIRFGGPRRDPI